MSVPRLRVKVNGGSNLSSDSLHTVTLKPSPSSTTQKRTISISNKSHSLSDTVTPVQSQRIQPIVPTKRIDKLVQSFRTSQQKQSEQRKASYVGLQNNSMDDDTFNTLQNIQSNDNHTLNILSQYDMYQLCQIFNVINIAYNEPVMKHGEIASFFGLLLKGTLTATVDTCTHTMHTGTFIGELAYFACNKTQKQRTADVVCSSDEGAVIAVITYNEFDLLQDTNIALYCKLMKLLSIMSIEKLMQRYQNTRQNIVQMSSPVQRTQSVSQSQPSMTRLKTHTSTGGMTAHLRIHTNDTNVSAETLLSTHLDTTLKIRSNVIWSNDTNEYSINKFMSVHPTITTLTKPLEYTGKQKLFQLYHVTTTKDTILSNQELRLMARDYIEVILRNYANGLKANTKQRSLTTMQSILHNEIEFLLPNASGTHSDTQLINSMQRYITACVTIGKNRNITEEMFCVNFEKIIGDTLTISKKSGQSMACSIM